MDSDPHPRIDLVCINADQVRQRNAELREIIKEVELLQSQIAEKEAEAKALKAKLVENDNKIKENQHLIDNLQVELNNRERCDSYWQIILILFAIAVWLAFLASAFRIR